MNKPVILSLFLFFIIWCGCIDQSKKSTDNTGTEQFFSTHADQSHPSYATLFTVAYGKNFKKVTVKNPFDTNRILQTYILVNRNSKTVEKLPEGKVIEIPVQSMGIAFTTHIGYADKLGLLDKITGVSQKKYIKNPSIKQKVKEGEIREFGPSHNIDVERLLNINPQILLVAPFKDNRYDKITDVGINLAINASYMENTPLARAEWIKFIACFFNKEAKANRVFDSIASHYHKLTHLTENISNKPTIFSGKKIGQVWYVPGGKSYLSKLFQDAGADYIWKDNSGTGSLPLDFETVYVKAKDADYWAIKENYTGQYNYKNLDSEFIHYSAFEAFKQRNILFCNTHKKPYYEQGILEPDILLADFIHLLHPELLPGHTPKYYTKLNP